MTRRGRELRVGDPLFVGMPAQATTFRTEYGRVHCGGDCRDDYDNMTYWQNAGGQVLRIQRSAARSLEEAEAKIGFAILVTGAHRTCEAQERYYASDPNRYAPPAKTAHTRGLAIDVSTRLPRLKQYRLRRALRARGWHQARPDDEPWHYSFGIQV